MNANELVECLGTARVLVIIRLSSSAHLDDVVDAVAASRVAAVEVSLTTPGALEWLARRRAADGRGPVVGLGTVRGERQAQDAISAGADFLVSPHFDPCVVGAAVQAGVAALPGAWTPSEAVAADACGAAAIKLFPAATGGPAHLRALRGPLPDLRFVPVGGVDEGNAGEYLRAGALGVGVGSAYVSDTVVERGEWATVTARLDALVDRCREAAGTV